MFWGGNNRHVFFSLLRPFACDSYLTFFPTVLEVTVLDVLLKMK